MTSQLNVDTIVDKAGSGGTNVKIGNTSTYVSENSAVTQNTVQGLTKAWNHYDQKGDSGSTQNLDSFNISSTTDAQTGVSTHTFTNGMNNNFSSTAGISIDRGTANLFTSGPETSLASASIKISCLNAAGSAADGDSLMIITCGDLA